MYRILVVYHRASTFGGSFNSVTDVLRRVDRSRYEPVGLLPGPGTCAEAFERLGIEVRHGIEKPSSRTVSYATAVANAAWLLRREGIDLLYVADYVAWRSSALLAARLAGIPSCVHVRMPLPAHPVDPELLRATLVIGNSHASIDALVPYRQASGLRVVYNFVDLERFEQGHDIRRTLFDGTPPVVGFVGVFRPEKGIKYFIEAAALLRRRQSNVRFVAVGGESSASRSGWLPRMREYATAQGLHDVMLFTGAREDIPDLMHSIDVLVVPSLNEGFGRVIVEAAAAGVPAVGSDAAGIPEVIERDRTGVLVPPRDAAAIASAVGRLLQDPDERRAMGLRARERAHRLFAPDEQMRALQQGWDDAIEGRVAGPTSAEPHERAK